MCRCAKRTALGSHPWLLGGRAQASVFVWRPWLHAAHLQSEPWFWVELAPANRTWSSASSSPSRGCSTQRGLIGSCKRCGCNLLDQDDRQLWPRFLGRSRASFVTTGICICGKERVQEKPLPLTDSPHENDSHFRMVCTGGCASFRIAWDTEACKCGRVSLCLSAVISNHLPDAQFRALFQSRGNGARGPPTRRLAVWPWHRCLPARVFFRENVRSYHPKRVLEGEPCVVVLVSGQEVRDADPGAAHRPDQVAEGEGALRRVTPTSTRICL